jgi:hypothetical protein
MIKIYNVNELVRYADRLATAIRKNLGWSRKLKGTVIVEKPKETKGGVSISISVGKYALDPRGKSLSGMARAFEYGSGVHSTKRAPETYPILPRNGGSLVFQGTHQWEGQLVVVPPMGGGVVMHPGVAPRPFLHPAVEENKERIRELLGSNIRQYIGTVIRTSWSKTK